MSSRRRRIGARVGDASGRHLRPTKYGTSRPAWPAAFRGSTGRRDRGARSAVDEVAEEGRPVTADPRRWPRAGLHLPPAATKLAARSIRLHRAPRRRGDARRRPARVTCSSATRHRQHGPHTGCAVPSYPRAVDARPGIWAAPRAIGGRPEAGSTPTDAPELIVSRAGGRIGDVALDERSKRIGIHLRRARGLRRIVFSTSGRRTPSRRSSTARMSSTSTVPCGPAVDRARDSPGAQQRAGTVEVLKKQGMSRPSARPRHTHDECARAPPMSTTSDEEMNMTSSPTSSGPHVHVGATSNPRPARPSANEGSADGTRTTPSDDPVETPGRKDHVRPRAAGRPSALPSGQPLPFGRANSKLDGICSPPRADAEATTIAGHRPAASRAAVRGVSMNTSSRAGRRRRRPPAASRLYARPRGAGWSITAGNERLATPSIGILRAASRARTAKGAGAQQEKLGQQLCLNPRELAV